MGWFDGGHTALNGGRVVSFLGVERAMGATQAPPELLGATMSFNSKIAWVVGATLLACLAIAAIGLSLLWQRYPQPTRITTADFILRSEADPQYCNDSDSAVFVLGTPPRTSTI